MNSFPAKSLLSCAILSALLQGCGGGGGGSSSNESSTAPANNSGAPTGAALTPVAPSASISFATKQLRINWPAVDGATYYRVLEDANNSDVFEQVGSDLTAPNFSRDIAIHTFNWNKRYRVQACNSSGCTDSKTLNASDGMLQAIGYFKASNTGSGDAFGWSIALSDDGNTLAVGAPYEDSNASGNPSNNGAVDSGAVYIFVKSGTEWVQQAYLKAPNIYAGDNFGESVALSANGNTLAIGAPFEDGSATTINGNKTIRSTSDAGAVYVFTRNGATWTEQAYVKPSNTYATAYFGWSVALSDNGATLAVGSPGEANGVPTLNTTNHTAANAGAAYVFKLGTTWGDQVYLKASSVAAEDNFGAAIALNGVGNTLAVGAPHKSNGIGRAYVFANNGTWGAVNSITASNGAVGDNFGATLALNTAGDTLAVGAPYKSSNGANSGAAYVFETATGTQQAYLKAANTEVDDDFGAALALSGDGNTLAVGAIGEKSGATGINGNTADNSKDGVGAVYLFNRSNGTAWSTQSTYVKPSTSTVGNEFGTAIGLSANGSTLAISGAFEQSNATGIGGTQTNTSAIDAGAVWLF